MRLKLKPSRAIAVQLLQTRAAAGRAPVWNTALLHYKKDCKAFARQMQQSNVTPCGRVRVAGVFLYAESLRSCIADGTREVTLGRPRSSSSRVITPVAGAL